MPDKMDYFAILQAAQSSLRSAHTLLRSIAAGENLARQSSIADGTVAEFKHLLSLLDTSLPQPPRKRIRKGPLLTSPSIDPTQFLEHSVPRSNLELFDNLKSYSQDPYVQPRLKFPVRRLIHNSSISFTGCSNYIAKTPWKHGSRGAASCTVSTGGCHCPKRRKDQHFDFIN
ncbi:hypothetical protein Cni_G08936 [Canna indica]|uniref:Uncharacterized protein n=1 Tax=Canna indica TaxID=4628 RepID=A0AAQ3Q8V6_9LILI|nr:hypothetical protein Cni_G08936 [Canna indica]